MRVVLHIDRLVLGGFPAAECDRIAAELRAELGRRLADPAAAGRLPALPHIASLRVAHENHGSEGTPARSGISAARAIARGLTR